MVVIEHETKPEAALRRPRTTINLGLCCWTA
jgi:hypothetical protein